MSPRGIVALHLVAVCLILAIGGSLVWQARAEPVIEAYALGTIGLSLLLAAISALSAGGRSLENATGSSVADKAGLDKEVEGVIDHLVVTIRRHLLLNHDYQNNLNGLNIGLQQLPSRGEVQDIIVKLMNKNMEMQAKVSDLSKELETSQQQIVSLRNNVTEVGKIALLDALTELGNRRFFDQTLQTEIARVKTDGGELCLAMGDLDRFKSVNDRFGHVVGDHLLRLFAGLLSQNMTGKGSAARYGGEEFALLFPATTLESAAAQVEKIRRELEAKQWVVGARKDRLGTITASFGVARYSPEESAEAFVRRADAKLFEAKSAGRNKVAVEARAPASLAQGARKALAS